MISAAAEAGGRLVILRHLGTFLSVGCRNETEGEAVSTGTAGSTPNNGPAGLRHVAGGQIARQDSTFMRRRRPPHLPELIRP